MLLLYPQEPDRTIRPGARRLPGSKGWGDYHPCNAEFFLARVHQRDEPEPWSIAGLLRLLRGRTLARTDYARLQGKLRDAVVAGRAAETQRWELDVADVPSQDEGRAWKAYDGMLKERVDQPYECVAYARWKDGVRGIALQYWYLYVYNDFWNNHEADWEMVTIVLTPDGSPQRIRLSSHHGGHGLPWSEAPRDGERPVVRVARGSHAGYFVYRKDGHDLTDLVRRTRLPGALRFLERLLKMLPPLGVRDHPPADASDAGALEHHRGVRVEPELRFVPQQPPDPATPEWADWWWLHYQGKWGSWHSRIAGTIGVDSPWGPVGQTGRWEDPAAWAGEESG